MALAGRELLGGHSGERMDIKGIVKDNTVRFTKYRKGIAYYAVSVPSEGMDYVFPVPLSDVGDATLLATDKALLFMRYIRKAMDEGTFRKASEGTPE